MPKSKKKGNDSMGAGPLIGFVVIILIVIFAASFYTKQSVSKDQLEIEQRAQLLQNKLTQLENELTQLKENTADAQAELESIPEFIYRVEAAGQDEFDRKITRVNVKEGKEEVLVESILELAEITDPNFALIEQAVFPDEGVILFRMDKVKGPGQDAYLSALEVWEYNANDNAIISIDPLQKAIDLPINTVWADSPELTKIAFFNAMQDVGAGSNAVEGSATELWVYDVLTRDLATVLSLSDDQTFNGGPNGPQGVHHGLSWKDENTLIVSIYGFESDPEDGTRSLIEQKEIILE